MKNRLLFFLALTVGCSSSWLAQFQRLEFELVENKNLVPGQTYRVYAVMSNQGDLIDAIFGEGESPLYIQSTKGFFQHPDGGALSRDILRYDVEKDEALRYDSWFTIGATDNYQNSVAAFPPAFEEALADFDAGENLETKDGAWFVTPDQRQCFANEDKRILLMQLTSSGKIYGALGLHGRTKTDDNGDFNVIKEEGIQFFIKRTLWSRLFKTDSFIYSVTY